MIEYTFTHKEFGSITLECPTHAEAHVNTQAYIWDYGLKQCLQDAYASAKSAAEFDGKLRKRFNKLISGEMRVTAQRVVRTELGREMDAIAEAKVNAAAAKKGLKIPRDRLAQYVADYRARFEDAVRSEAEVNIEKRRAAAAEVNLDDDFFADMK